MKKFLGDHTNSHATALEALEEMWWTCSGGVVVEGGTGADIDYLMRHRCGTVVELSRIGQSTDEVAMLSIGSGRTQSWKCEAGGSRIKPGAVVGQRDLILI